MTPDPYWQKVASDTTKPGRDPKYPTTNGFEGYAVYRSKDGSEWTLIGQCDLADSIMFNYPPGGDSVNTPDSLWLRATDSGTFYTLLDTNVTNGFIYYYSVNAYSWNYQTTKWDSLHKTPLQWDTLILRSGLTTNYTTVPLLDRTQLRAADEQK